MTTGLRCTPRQLASAAAVSLALVVTGCGTSTSAEPGGDGEGRTTAAADSGADAATEEAGPQPRLVATYDGGVLVLDPATGDVLLDEPVDGYLRLSDTGDGRTALLSRSGGWSVLDTGSWTEAHGDHGHSWTLPPVLTDEMIPAEEPGHAVAHHGSTVLWDDGTGTITTVETAEFANAREGGVPLADTEQAPDAHHGLAYRDSEGNLVTTVGDADTRSGIRISDPSGTELAQSSDCPGVHGEAFGGDAAVFGCEDGVLIVRGTDISKVQAPDDYARIGNQAGHETAPFVLGDYKTDRDAELERPTRVSVVDTRDGSLELVDLPSSYSFRSLGRTPEGDGLVLGTDGALHHISVADGAVSRSLPVVGAWREPLDWHQPRPSLEVVGDTAYVSEPATRTIHAVDLASWKVTSEMKLPVAPDELLGVTG